MKSTPRFLTPLRLEYVADGSGQKRLLEPLVFESLVAKQIFIVPAGFVTDLASVPRLPVVFWLTGAAADTAAVVHDYLYSTGRVPRAMADAVFREASAVEGVPGWRRWLMWAGVRLGGASHYAEVPA